PHPDSIKLPTMGERPSGFWVITVGQEVGIFYDWNDVGRRTNHVSGAIQKKYPTFQEALQHYRRSYELQELSAVPVPNGPFWPKNCAWVPVATSPEPMLSPSPTSSDEIWSQLDDLSLYMSQAPID
ncbi:hypothetical protein BV22DRAFT_1024895, partial [Leucogyrophana mollusca]